MAMAILGLNNKKTRQAGGSGGLQKFFFILALAAFL